MAASLNRLLKLAEIYFTAKDEKSFNLICVQFDSYIKKHGHMEPRNDGTTPNPWKRNMDYSEYENSPYFGSVSEFLKKFPGGIRDWVVWRNKTKKQRNQMYDNLSSEPKKACLLNCRAQMEKFPIAADPAMWSEEQIVEVLQTPHLLEKLQKDPDLFMKVLKQTQKRKIKFKGLFPKDIGEWREHGWFFLHGGGGLIPLGFFDSREAAEMARKKMINAFANGEKWLRNLDTFLLNNFSYQDTVWQEMQDIARKDNNNVQPDQEMSDDIETGIDELLTHPLYEKRRRHRAEKWFQIFKMPEDFEPPPEAKVKGLWPTPAESEASSGWKEGPDVGDADFGDADFVEPVTKRVYHRAKMRQKDLDPNKMANDGKMMADDKDSLREELADLEHEQWMKWAKDIIKSEDISEDRAKRWKEECFKPYDKLSEKMKDFDREWADKVLKIIKKYDKVEKKAHYEPIGGDDVDKFEKEQPLYSDRGLEKFKSIQDFLKQYHQEGQSADDAARKAVEDMIGYWKLLRKSKKRRKGKKD